MYYECQEQIVPQHGTNFWGGAKNNYGFGDSNIVSAVQNHQSLNTTPIPLNNQQPLTPIPTTTKQASYQWEQIPDDKIYSAKKLKNISESVIPNLISDDNTLNTSEYYIKDGKNYAWDNPKHYDRRGNIASVYNNFIKINNENPINKPISTGNILNDATILRSLANKYPKTAAMIKAYNAGYLGAGYYDNLKQAYKESHFNDTDLFAE